MVFEGCLVGVAREAHSCSSGLKLAARAVCALAESLRSGKVDATSVSQSSTCKIGHLKHKSAFLWLKYDAETVSPQLQLRSRKLWVQK